MDQFSHDLTLALEETSLMDRACGVGRWGSRRRTRSTGNLPCAPQPTEDSSSSPTDTMNNAHGHGHGHHPNTNANIDGLDTHTHNDMMLPASDSDDKAEAMLPLRLPGKMLNAAAAVRMGMGALESDSLNETNFSPARFYKPNSRRKRKIKRMSMEFEFSKDCNLAVSPHSFTESPLHPGMLGGCAGSMTGTGTVRKRVLKMDSGNRSNLFFCGKRKRSNRDRYHEHDQEAGVPFGGGGCSGEGGSGSSKLHSSSMPRYTHIEEYHRMRPRSYSSTSKPHSDRLLPLNKGLLSKINRIAQTQTETQRAQKTDNTSNMEEEGLEHEQAETQPQTAAANPHLELVESAASTAGLGVFSMETLVPVSDIETLLNTSDKLPLQLSLDCAVADYHAHRQKSHYGHMHGSGSTKAHRRRRFCQTPQPLQVQSMDCTELYDFFSSSSLSSSSDSEDGHRLHDTDREGDDELTDWPGNEIGPGGKYDPKRKLTKKSLLPQIRSDDTIGEDDTLMSGTEATATMTFADSYGGVGGGTSQSPPQTDALQDLTRFQPAASSEPIEICGGGANRGNRSVGFIGVNICLDTETSMNGMPALKQIESEMSGETSNPFLSSSPPMQIQEVREIRAGCRRINGDRPGFSIKLSVNERLARFLQDSRQTQIRLPDIEIYEQDSLLNLATLYSLNMLVENGCTVLTKTRNTTQSSNIDPQHGLQQRPDLLSDFKRRCYGGNGDNTNTPVASDAFNPATAATPAGVAAELLPKK
ncbi:uncharacterized protein LOC115765360 isoform X1 [Drosophila novamexicana]|uniref:uncharacterized protein LOC115765360 isoform X1 n=1 Tax=Drosophila novamexicana TaxID=47314 RepID=UPI0011E58C5E|nr:uncharacterized protein LOC115765360 isoform X1 [Drosophila novamexicana]